MSQLFKGRNGNKSGLGRMYMICKPWGLLNTLYLQMNGVDGNLQLVCLFHSFLRSSEHLFLTISCMVGSCPYVPRGACKQLYWKWLALLTVGIYILAGVETSRQKTLSHSLL